MQSNDNLYALHLSFPELKELIEAERQHSEKLRSDGSDPTLAERIMKKATLLSAFTRQRYAVKRAKEHAAMLRKDYELYTFGSDHPVDHVPDE